MPFPGRRSGRRPARRRGSNAPHARIPGTCLLHSDQEPASAPIHCGAARRDSVGDEAVAARTTLDGRPSLPPSTISALSKSPPTASARLLLPRDWSAGRSWREGVNRRPEGAADPSPGHGRAKRRPGPEQACIGVHSQREGIVTTGAVGRISRRPAAEPVALETRRCALQALAAASSVERVEAFESFVALAMEDEGLVVSSAVKFRSVVERRSPYKRRLKRTALRSISSEPMPRSWCLRRSSRSSALVASLPSTSMDAPGAGSRVSTPCSTTQMSVIR